MNNPSYKECYVQFITEINDFKSTITQYDEDFATYKDYLYARFKVFKMMIEYYKHENEIFKSSQTIKVSSS